MAKLINLYLQGTKHYNRIFLIIATTHLLCLDCRPCP
jgi:hypothetical protein